MSSYYLPEISGSYGSGPTVEEFPKDASAVAAFLKKYYVLHHPPLDSAPEMQFECVICASPDKTLVDCSLTRKCAVSSYPCDGLPCQCKPTSFYICFDCLASNLWSSSSSILKDQKRFRAKCPFCKASYCHLDIVYYTLPNSKPTSPSPQSKSSQSSRRRRKDYLR